jgi:uncharacterized protein
MSEAERREFFTAIGNGDALKVQQLLDASPELIYATEDKGSPLHFAAIENQRGIVDLLLTYGADLNARDGEFDMTPMGWANEKGHTEMVQYLFAHGAEVNLNSAAAFGLIDCVQECLEQDQSQVNEMERYSAPVHQASLWGHPDIVKLLMENGADPELRNSHGQTALEISRAQVESGCRATALVIPTRRREIEAGCREVVRVLENRQDGAVG